MDIEGGIRLRQAGLLPAVRVHQPEPEGVLFRDGGGHDEDLPVVLPVVVGVDAVVRQLRHVPVQIRDDELGLPPPLSRFGEVAEQEKEAPKE